MIFRDRLILLILFFTLVLRLLATNPGHPPNHPDEPLVYWNAANMIINRDADPHKYNYPALPMYIHAIIYSNIFAPFSILGDLITNPKSFFTEIKFEQYINSITIQNSLYWGRYVTVIFSLLCIFLTFLIGKKVFGYHTGLIAALFLSVNFRYMASSVLALNDIPNSFFALLVIFALINLLKERSRRKYVIVGILLALSLSVKYQTFTLISFLTTQLIIGLNSKAHSFTRKLKNIFTKDFFISSFILLIVLVAINIFTVMHFSEWKSWFDIVTKIDYGVGKIGIKFYPLWFMYNIGLGQIISFFTIGGVLLSLFNNKTRKYSLIFLSLIFPVLFFYAYYSYGVHTRNLSVITPFLILFASYFYVSLFTLFTKRIKESYKLIFLILIALIISYPVLKYTIYQSYYLSRATNFECLEKWMNNNFKKRIKVGIHPPVPTAALQSINADLVHYDLTTDFTLPELQRSKMDYLIINIDYYQSNYFLKWLYHGSLFWDIPVDILDNTLPSMVLRHLNNFIVKKCEKPWPVIESNFWVVRIPKPYSNVNVNNITLFTFDNDKEKEKWKTIHNRELKSIKIIQNALCYKGKCLNLEQQKINSYYARGYPEYISARLLLFNSPRLQSPIIKALPGKLYRIKGYAKASNGLQENKKDGFLRLNFYRNNENILKNKPLITYASVRLNDKGWQELVVEGVAPKETKYLSVGFQSEYLGNDFLIDQVEIFESKSLIDQNFDPIDIEDNILYPSFIL